MRYHEGIFIEYYILKYFFFFFFLKIISLSKSFVGYREIFFSSFFFGNYIYLIFGMHLRLIIFTRIIIYKIQIESSFSSSFKPI